MSNTELIDCYF